MSVRVRDYYDGDEAFLWEILYQSIYVPKGEEELPRSILDEPAIAKYLKGWGRFGDMALVAEADGRQVGAVWARLFDEANKGYGYVDSMTPEIGIAVVPEYRGQGIGGRLMRGIEMRAKSAGFRRLSLSVDPQNPAVRFYERLGYVHVGWSGTSSTMVKALA